MKFDTFIHVDESLISLFTVCVLCVCVCYRKQMTADKMQLKENAHQNEDNMMQE